MEHGKGGREGVGLVKMGKGQSSSMRSGAQAVEEEDSRCQDTDDEL
jgi:hypothetical protein